MVGRVPLIACGNVANLLIARGFRASGRSPSGCRLARREVSAVRGSSRSLASWAGFFGVALSVFFTRTSPRVHPLRSSLLVEPTPDLRILTFAFTVTLITGVVLRPAACASRKPSRSREDAEGHGRIHRRRQPVAVPAQGPGDGAGCPQFPLALRCWPLHAQPAEPASAQRTPASASPRTLSRSRLDPSLNGYDERARATNFQNLLRERIAGGSPASSAAGCVGRWRSRRLRLAEHAPLEGPRPRKWPTRRPPTPAACLLQGHACPCLVAVHSRFRRPADAVGRQPRVRAARRDRRTAASPSTSSRPSTWWARMSAGATAPTPS